MRFKYPFLLVLLLLFTAKSVHSQNQEKTAYEKKVTELTIKYFSICYYGYNKPLSMYEKAELEMYTNGEEARKFILGLGIINYAMYHTEAEVKKLVAQIDSDFKAAEKLKTSVDFQREKEAKLKKEQLANERKLRETREAYLKTDKGRIYNNIAISFDKWNRKGEFEKEADYRERLKQQSKNAFDKICYDQLKKRISEINYNLEYNFKREISTYNSEGEYFNLSFKYNGISWQNKFSIPISNAVEFKEKWNKLKVSIDNYNWCFVENSMLPTLVTLQEFESFDYYDYEREQTLKPIKTYSFPYTQKNHSEITIEFDELNLENEFLKGYVFKFSEIKLIEDALKKEAFRLDSLELANFNAKLDSIYTNLNEDLIANPYNTDKRTLTNYKQIGNDLKPDYDETISELRQIKFEQYKSQLQRDYYSLNDNFERELKTKKPSEYCQIYFDINPAKKKEADMKYTECRCNYSSRLDFDLKFIEGKVSSCNCREKEFQKNGALFSNRQDFDNFYDKGDDEYFKELEIRKLKKEEELAIADIRNNSSKIENLDFRDIHIKSTSNEYAAIYFKKITQYKTKPYYSIVVETLIDVNKGLNKEWQKNGHFFDSKTDFYESFTCGEYKQKLKERKKQKK